MTLLGVNTSIYGILSIGLLYEDRIVEVNYFDFYYTDELFVYSIAYLLETMNVKPSDIDFYSVVVGPGSFTGLRIGVSVIKTLAWINKKKVLPLSSLELLALSIKECVRNSENTILVPMIEARRNSIFSAIFSSPDIRVTEDMEIEPSNLLEILNEGFSEKKNVFFIGQVSEKIKNELEKLDANKLFYPPSFLTGRLICEVSRMFIESGRGLIEPDCLQPNYIRRSEAELQLEISLDQQK